MTRTTDATGTAMTDREIRAVVAKLRLPDGTKAHLFKMALVERRPEVLRSLEVARRTERRLAVLKRRASLTLDEAREVIGWSDSYSRLPDLVRLYRRMESRADLLTLLGEEWSGCDNVWRFAALLEIILPDGVAPEMMTAAERAALERLPEVVAIYRGADRGVNEAGLSWSLDAAVASRFPFLMRYRAKEPVLVTATVARDRIVAVKLDRSEAEVTTKGAIVSSVAPLGRPAGLEAAVAEREAGGCSWTASV